MATAEKREAITVRFPPRVLEAIREAKGGGESLNDFVVRILDQEARWIRARKAHERIRQLRAEIIARNGGTVPDSTAFIRDLREGRER